MERSSTHTLTPRRRAVLWPLLLGAAALPLTSRRVLASTSLVLFFGWNSAELSNTARERIALAFSRLGQFSIYGERLQKIDIHAHADRSGSEDYNLQLSERRAKVVYVELLRLGMPHEDLTLWFWGESRLFIPMPDGVAEPHNRFVQLVVR